MKTYRYQLVLACVAILFAAVAAKALTPRLHMADTAEKIMLETALPKAFAGWTPVPDVRVVEPPGSDTLARELYSQEVSRGYANADGAVVMLLVAYGPSQSDRLQLHRPEVCYTAQGFRVTRLPDADVSYNAESPPVKTVRLVTRREDRVEPVTYWMRVGNDLSMGQVERQMIKVQYGLRGLIPDGALIRVSSVGLNTDEAFRIETKFIQDLLESASPELRRFLIGDPSQALMWRR